MTDTLNAKVTDPADFLDAWADTIDRDGWCRHRFGNSQGHHCVVGAQYITRIESRAEKSVADAARGALEVEVGILGRQGLAHWNDNEVNDKRTVTRTLRRAARKLRGGTR